MIDEDVKLEPLRSQEVNFEAFSTRHTQETDASVDKIPIWEKRQDTFLQRVEVEEQCVKITEDSLRSLKNKLITYSDDLWSSKTLIDRIDKINLQKKKCRVTIGFVGSTGTGKSTLINALVGERDLLPSDHGDACTSVIVELLWNPNDDEAPKYEARIRFTDRQEWQKDLEKLCLDIAAEKVQDNDEDGELDSELTHRIDETMARVKAVYPHIKCKADLLKTGVKKLMAHENVAQLGKETHIVNSFRKTFSSEIRPFVDSKAGQGMAFALWPLVKLVQIFIKSEFLKDGIVLVDIPGNSDSNAARDSLAKSYMQKLSVTCVLSRANRAPADKGAQDLVMSRATQRTMQLDGLWNADKLCFIVARTDESLIVESYIDRYPDLAHTLVEDLNHKLRCEQEQNRIQKDIENYEIKQDSNRKSRKQLTAELRRQCSSVEYDQMSHSKKRKFTEDDDDDESLTEYEKQIAIGTRKVYNQRHIKKVESEYNDQLLRKKRLVLSQIAEDLNKIDSRLRATCIKHRNMSAEVAIKANFERVAKEIGLDHSGKPLNVFCVSALMYLNRLDGRTDCGFLREVDTGVPALRRWLIETTLGSRHHNAKTYLTQAGKFEQAIKSFAEDTKGDHKMTHHQRENLEHAFDKATKDFLKSFSSLSSSCGAQLQAMFEANIQKTIMKIERTIGKTANLLVKNFAKRPMHWSTYRAINSNHGTFKNSKGITYNWNEELAGIYLDPLIAPWNQVFNVQLSTLQRSYDEEALKQLSMFADNLTTSSESICPLIGDTLSSLRENITQVKESLEENSHEVFQELIPDEAKNIHRLVEPVILETMTPGYDKCGSIRGKKVFQRMQDELRAHTEKKRKMMYKSCGTVIRHALAELSDTTTQTLDVGPDLAVEEIKQLLTLMLDNHTVDERHIDPSPTQSLAKVRLRQDILEIFQAMSASFEQNVTLPIEEVPKELEIIRIDPDNLGDDNIDDMGELSEDGGNDFP